jgi:hypothetical protein
MFLASPGAVADLVRYHGLRGLQIESTLGALVGAGRIVLGTSRPSTISYGSFNLDGAFPDALARLTVPLTLAGIAALVVLAARAARAMPARRAGDAADEPARIERLACAALAGTIVLWLTGKVFSPQYLTWGIPLVLAIPGRRGVQAIWVAIAAFAVTQLYYRGFYDQVFDQRPVGVITVLLRQAILVGLLVLVCSSWPRRSPRSEGAALLQRG